MLSSFRFFTVLAFLLTLGFIPIIIQFCKFYSLYDTVNSRKIHSGNIPRLGGVGFVLSFVICCIICFKIDPELNFYNAIPLIAAGFLIFLFGIIDDILELKAFIKLIVQIVAAAIVVLNGYHISCIGPVHLPLWLSYSITLVWIVGIINAYNLIDGMDGLCGMLGVTYFVTMGIILNGDFNEGTAICFILAASICGFLVYNWPCPNARIFMGDGGSQFIGFMVATVPLFTSNSNAVQADSNMEYYKFLIMVVLVSFPLLDTIAAVWRRLRDHRPIMSPDRLHLHHKLLNLGFSKVSALYIVFVIQFLICMTAILSVFLEDAMCIFLLLIAFLFMIGFYCVIHYTNKAVLRKITKDNEQRNKGEVPRL